MPAEKPLTIATYAAGASLAAITLVYVFGPTFFLDGEGSTGVKPAARRPAVGLVNPANDCFINSVLQALAGLPDLRKYLIKELHIRKLDGPDVYKVTSAEVEGKGKSESAEIREYKKLEGLRAGVVTQALKSILDKLNERPIYRKTISAQEFVVALEFAFRTRISRQQQDAQEFLQVVTERLCDEYHAGQKARRKARTLAVPGLDISPDDSSESTEEDVKIGIPTSIPPHAVEVSEDDPTTDGLDDGFPFEGKMESQIECDFCHFTPRPAVSSFVTLTLNVPQRSSTTLNHCFDGMLKVETIDDFKCDKCRLDHALEIKRRQLSGTRDEEKRGLLETELEKLQAALEEDPEKPPEDVELPDLKSAPKRRIKKHTRISLFPKILAIHLSRSIYTSGSASQKNMAKVSFPESLPLGSIVDQKKYKLLGVVTHKGGHNSGHYETFRRQITSIPFSTPHSFGGTGAYSQKGSPRTSAVQSPRISAQMSERSRLTERSVGALPSTEPSTPTLVSPSTSSLSSRSSLSSMSRFHRKPAPTSAPRSEVMFPATILGSSSVRLSTASSLGSGSATTPITPNGAIAKDSVSGVALGSSMGAKDKLQSLKRPRRKKDNKWWRISDDRVKESRTGEVLGMQREVYLLFYELVRGEDGD